MTQKAINYGIVLYQLGISQDMVEEIKALVDGSPELVYALADPVVSHADKRKVVDRVFDRFGNKDLVNFMKTLCDNDGFDMIHDIFDEYEKYDREQQDILSATLYYVTPPTDRQKAGGTAFHGGEKRIDRWICHKNGRPRVRQKHSGQVQIP